MNKAYHRFVFNERGLVGDFEGMYRAEDTEGFDAWGARDPRHLRMRLVKEIIADYNFPTILDLGCGTGSFTAGLKRVNNTVFGIDISPTAIKKARETYPDISFEVNNIATMHFGVGSYDLVSIQMVLAYIKDWELVLYAVRNISQYCVVCEYVPGRALGYVKSIPDLQEQFGMWFDIERKVIINDETAILFGKVK